MLFGAASSGSTAILVSLSFESFVICLKLKEKSWSKDPICQENFKFYAWREVELAGIPCFDLRDDSTTPVVVGRDVETPRPRLARVLYRRTGLGTSSGHSRCGPIVWAAQRCFGVFLSARGESIILVCCNRMGHGGLILCFPSNQSQYTNIQNHISIFLEHSSVHGFDQVPCAQKGRTAAE